VSLPAEKPSPALVRGQILTLSLLVLGYAGYYFCRSHLSVCTPQIIEELSRVYGFTPEDAKLRIGGFVSLGTLAYAVGKFASGGLADFLGGRRNFLLGMLGAILCTILFTLGGTASLPALPVFTLAWVLNRAIQSMGWVGIVKVSAKWFSYSRYGTVMGIISLSYLLGDAAARAALGALITGGLSWRGVFLCAAGLLTILLLTNQFLLKETPRDIGEPEPQVNPENLFGEEGDRSQPAGLGPLLLPLVRSPAFWLICLLSVGFTLLRETFNTWTPTYYTEFVGLSKGEAAQKSAFFPLLGGLSVFLAGAASDRIGRIGRAAILLGGILLTAGLLFLLGQQSGGTSGVGQTLPVIFVSLIGLVMIGPYSYLAGAISLDFGGKQGSATACGIIDGVGYLGGILAGGAVARLSTVYGWSGAFQALAVVAISTGVVALLYLLQQRQKKSQ
jgi:OPA family glycerol-3-phosphate transporter-like MFS transporter